MSMNTESTRTRYAKCIEASKRIRWDIERDVIRGRRFDLTKKFLPDGLSLVDELDFLSADERRLLSQIQGRTYANMFGLVERFIGAKMLEVSRAALARRPGRVRGAGALHRRGAQAPGAVPPPRGDDGRRHAGGLRVRPRRRTPWPRPCSSKSTWAVLGADAVTSSCSRRRTTARASSPTAELSELWKDVFLFHWKEESQHAILDELEWQREDATAHRGASATAPSTT